MPDVAGVRPAMMRRRVDLPLPEGPVMNVWVFGGIVRVRFVIRGW